MKQNKTFMLILSGIFIALAVTTQYLGKTIPGVNQLIVGSLVNCILISSALYCIVTYSSIVAILTPVTAFLIGVVPSLQGPFMPFICLGNLLLVLTFVIFRNSIKSIGIYIGVVISSIVKFTFLYISANYFINIFGLSLPNNIKEALKISMGITQLITALIGGIIAILLYNMLKKRKVIR